MVHSTYYGMEWELSIDCFQAPADDSRHPVEEGADRAADGAEGLEAVAAQEGGEQSGGHPGAAEVAAGGVPGEHEACQ